MDVISIIAQIGSALAAIVAAVSIIAIFFRLGRVAGKFEERLEGMSKTQEDIKVNLHEYRKEDKHLHSELNQTLGKLTERVAVIEARTGNGLDD